MLSRTLLLTLVATAIHADKPLPVFRESIVVTAEAPLVDVIPANRSCNVIVPCSDQPPADAYGEPLCFDYSYHALLIDQAREGDPLALQLLERRYATAYTFFERQLLAAHLLGRVPYDLDIWNEHYAFAELAVRFAGSGTEPTREFLEWCEKHAMDPKKTWNVAYTALRDVVSQDPRSRALLLQALTTDDASIVSIAIHGLATQEDILALLLIEQALMRFPDQAPDMAQALKGFRNERADAIAVKYISGMMLDHYMKFRE